MDYVKKMGAGNSYKFYLLSNVCINDVFTALKVQRCVFAMLQLCLTESFTCESAACVPEQIYIFLLFVYIFITVVLQLGRRGSLLLTDKCVMSGSSCTFAICGKLGTLNDKHFPIPFKLSFIYHCGSVLSDKCFQSSHSYSIACKLDIWLCCNQMKKYLPILPIIFWENSFFAQLPAFLGALISIRD